MRRRTFVGGLVAAGVTPLSRARAQEAFPSRPITFIVPWGPGGGADQLARTMSRILESEFKVSLPVVNVPGATGQTGLSKLLNSPADGYSLAVLTGDTFSLFAGAQARLKVDQFIPLAVMIQQPSGFYVKIDSPWKTWDDVKAAAKEKSLRVAITGYGSPDDFTVNYYKTKGLKLEGIPFPEPGLRYSSVIGGQSDVLYEQAGDVRSFLDGKQIRPVLFFSEKPFDIYPDIPYSKALGDNVFLTQFRAILAKAGTDPKIVERLVAGVDKVAHSPDYAAYLKQQLGDPNSYVPFDKVGAYMKGWIGEANALAALVAKK